ncbi:hypothetical protein ACE6H2_020560 [Prunus campanulata]
MLLGRRLWASWFLEWRALRKAGFTEQRLLPALGSGRITGQCHPDPLWPARLSQLNQNLFWLSLLFPFFFFLNEK